MKRLIRFYDSAAGFISGQHWVMLLLIRLTLGVLFAQSGWGKLHNLPHVIEYFTSLGLPKPEFQAYLVAITELVGGILLLIGFLTRLASIPLAFTMVIALLTAKSADISSVTDLPGIAEFLYIVLFLVLIFEGAGAFSLDRILKASR